MTQTELSNANPARRPVNLVRARRLSVAPMMDWTDRHCRMFHRHLSRHALLYTEMVTAAAIVHGKRDRLLDFDPAEHPVALQVGGSEPAVLARAVGLARDWGYDEVNLNVGCPSDRVQSGCFGAVLMKSPELVADCVRAMQDQSDVPVTVKCRIGVDDQDPETVLPAFLETMARAGVEHVIVHARKAWLQGLSPKENREIPPLDYPLVLRMKAQFPQLTLSINGGIASLDAALAMLDRGMDGVMIGRAAYHDPFAILGAADLSVWGQGAAQDGFGVAQDMLPYIEAVMSRGGKLHDVTRHMLGLFAGQPGARAFRRVLSEAGAGARDLKPYFAALDAVRHEAERARNLPARSDMLHAETERTPNHG